MIEDKGSSAARKLGGRSASGARGRAWNLGTGEELEVALRAAERLLVQAGEQRRHEHNRRFTIISIIIGTILSLFASLVAVVEVSSFSSSGMRVTVTVFPVLAAAVILGISIVSLVKERSGSSLDPTLRLAVQIASMVGEAMVDVADREGWSYLRVESTKLRLAAFPLLDRPRLFGRR